MWTNDHVKQIYDCKRAIGYRSWRLTLRTFCPCLPSGRAAGRARTKQAWSVGAGTSPKGRPTRNWSQRTNTHTHTDRHTNTHGHTHRGSTKSHPRSAPLANQQHDKPRNHRVCPHGITPVTPVTGSWPCLATVLGAIVFLLFNLRRQRSDPVPVRASYRWAGPLNMESITTTCTFQTGSDDQRGS